MIKEKFILTLAFVKRQTIMAKEGICPNGRLRMSYERRTTETDCTWPSHRIKWNLT